MLREITVIALLLGIDVLSHQAQPAPAARPPAVSPLGARNDLPNPYGAGASWGRCPMDERGDRRQRILSLPTGRSGRSTGAACQALACNCADSPLDPILQFDMSGRVLKSSARV